MKTREERRGERDEGRKWCGRGDLNPYEESSLDPEPSASANSATPARERDSMVVAPKATVNPSEWLHGATERGREDGRGGGGAGGSPLRIPGLSGTSRLPMDACVTSRKARQTIA